MSKYIFDWDEGNMHKSETKHGISKSETESCFIDANKKIISSYKKDSEIRYICIGISKNKNLLSNVFCFRKEKIRIISSRKANKKEAKIYW